MARTVSSTLIVPRDQALARAEVMALHPDEGAGVAVVCEALNTLFDHHRSTEVSDFAGLGGSYTGNPIIDAVGQIARYRPKTLPGEYLTSERVEVFAYLHLARVSAGYITIEARELGSGDSVVYTTNSLGVTGWVSLGVIDVADEIAYLDLEVEITDAGPYVATDLFGIRAEYIIDASELAAGPTEHDIIPLDLAHCTGECPLSVHRLDDAHAMASHLWTRTGTIAAVARPAAVVPLPTAIDAEIPPGCSGLTVWLYTATGALTTLIRATCDGDTASITVAGGWQSLHLDVTPPPDDGRGIREVWIEIVRVSGDGTVEDLSAYLDAGVAP